MVPSLSRQFKATIKEHGLRAAMRLLNAKVPYRYSAIFAFNGYMLRNICLIDKEDQTVTGCSDQPITDSYCIYVQRSNEKFGVEEALLDRRVEGHPKRGVYQCYYGAPLYGVNGKMLGTVCHFDSAPIHPSAEVATDLDDLAPVIAEAVFTE
jgi:hypothetical protein